MFSKAILSKVNHAKRAFGSNPGIVHRVMNTFDKSTTNYGVASYRPDQELKGHEPVELDTADCEYQATTLSNGFTVLTESEDFPGSVHMGFLMNVGTRDETPETSGSLQALKNVYLKTLKHTNETVNYGMIQMSGGDMEMDYDQETTYFRGHCIEYDTVDMFQMLVDIALEPRSVLASNVAKSKNRKSHDLAHHLAKFDPFAYNESIVLRTAYGYNTLGMPRLGLEGNVENIDARMLAKFIMDNVTPRKCLILGSGVKNHAEFVNLAKERLGEFLPVPEHQYERQGSEYIGGEFRNWTETPNTNITVAFEGANWNSSDQATFQVMAALLGSTDSLSRGQLGSGSLCRSVTNLSQKHSFVDRANVINAHFSDSGLFGLSLVGPGSNSTDLMDVLLTELNELKDGISDEELHRTKNRLKMNVLSEMEIRGDRLEEVGRNYLAFGGDLTFHQYADRIDSVTSSDINEVAERMLATKPTIVVQGSAINVVPTINDVQRQLN
jgi:processing peptidase subunit alpha